MYRYKLQLDQSRQFRETQSCSSKGQRFGEFGYQAAFHCDDVTSAPQTRRPEITWGMLKITWGCHAMNHTIFNQQHDLFMKKLTSGNVCRRKKKKNEVGVPFNDSSPKLFRRECTSDGGMGCNQSGASIWMTS